MCGLHTRPSVIKPNSHTVQGSARCTPPFIPQLSVSGQDPEAGCAHRARQGRLLRPQVGAGEGRGGDCEAGERAEDLEIAAKWEEEQHLATTKCGDLEKLFHEEQAISSAKYTELECTAFKERDRFALLEKELD